MACLALNVRECFGLVCAKALMVLITRPKRAPWIELAKVWLLPENIFRRPCFEHGLCNSQTILLRHVHRQVNVRSSKTERAELKPKTLQLRKTSPARINGTLLPEHFLPALRHKHKHHPVTPRILPFPLHYWLFSLIATQNCLYRHFSYCAVTKRRVSGAARDRGYKKNQDKETMTDSFTDLTGHAVFSAT